MTVSVTGAAAATTPASALPSISSRDEQKIRAAKMAVESLTVRQDKASDERKAIARKKAEDLKARIQMLKMSMPANPEAVGRLIAQLARELGAAVKAYGGTGSGLGAGTEVSAATPAAGAETAAPTETTPTEAAPTDDASADASSGATPKDPYRAAMAAQAAGAADRARKSESARQDSEFATTVKQMLAELKAMAAKAAADAKADAKSGGDATAPGVAEAGKALDAVDAALDTSGLSGVMVSLIV